MKKNRINIHFILGLLFSLLIQNKFVICENNQDIEKVKENIKKFFFNDKKDIDFALQFNKLREYYNFADPYEGLSFYNEIIKNPHSLNTEYKKGMIYNAIASQYTKLRQYEIAAKYYFQSIFAAQKSSDSSRVAWNYIDIGNLYYNYNQFGEAINYYKMAIPIFDSLIHITPRRDNNPLDEELGLAVATENIGLCMYGFQKYDSALYYIKKMEKTRLDPRQPPINKQYYYVTLGITYFLNKQYDSAHYYAQLSLNIDPSKQLKDIDIPEYHRFKSNAEIILGQCYIKKKKNDLGFEYFDKALKTLEYFKSKGPQLTVYSIITSFLLNNGYPKEAYKYLTIGRAIASKNPDLTYQRYLLLTRAAEVYTKLNQIDRAKSIQDTIISYLDSLTNRVSSQNINIAKIDVELQNNLQKIELLNLEKDYQEQQLANQSTIMWLLVGIAIVLAGLFATIYYIYHQRQKVNKQLALQNDELNKLNTRLSESLKLTEQMNIELVASQEELSRINENLEASNQTKNTLFSIIAHDLKNAIGGVRTLNQLLVDDFERFDKEELQELIKMMNNSSYGMYKLLENLLLWSSSQRGNIKPNKELNYPYFVVNNSIHLYTQAASEKKITIENIIPKDFSFVFDASLFDTIVRNLVNNAIKFSNEGGKIHISCTPQVNDVLFCICDNGVGMPQEKADNIFNLNSKKTTTGTKGEKGTGLGLMVCYDFVRMHNGKIWFESEVGKGTKAFFTLEYLKPREETESDEQE